MNVRHGSRPRRVMTGRHLLGTRTRGRRNFSADKKVDFDVSSDGKVATSNELTTLLPAMADRDFHSALCPPCCSLRSDRIPRKHVPSHETMLASCAYPLEHFHPILETTMAGLDDERRKRGNRALVGLAGNRSLRIPGQVERRGAPRNGPGETRASSQSQPRQSAG
jgi:hypothetical protein